MQRFTIRDIENLTGIKAHTLRIWEQRYDFFQPKRKESLHRYYDNEDLKQLLRIAFLYHQGWKVSKIAALSGEQLLDEMRKTAAPAGDKYIPVLIESALDFNAQVFMTALDKIRDEIGFERCVVEVCYPYLQKLGLLWCTNNVIPAQEHFSSYIIQNRIIAETASLPPLQQPPGILLMCPGGEFHELPLLFLNYLVKKAGMNALYLGANISKEALADLQILPSIQVIYMHLITNFTGLTADAYMNDFCQTFPDKKIVVSGEGSRYITVRPANLQLLETDADIREFIAGLRYERTT